MSLDCHACLHRCFNAIITAATHHLSSPRAAAAQGARRRFLISSSRDPDPAPGGHLAAAAPAAPSWHHRPRLDGRIPDRLAAAEAPWHYRPRYVRVEAARYHSTAGRLLLPRRRRSSGGGASTIWPPRYDRAATAGAGAGAGAAAYSTAQLQRGSKDPSSSSSSSSLDPKTLATTTARTSNGPQRSSSLRIRGSAEARELQWLKDPLKLADRIRLTLRDRDLEKALALVRQASNVMKCTVSWNHLIDYQMHQGMVKSSIRTYNEMKKRGQTPDAYTFTLLFRGLANHSSYGSAVGKALSLYHSMHEPKSPVQPTILHTNAVLKVCARAKDMDSMWGVAAKLPEHGMGAPDAVTFTTLLNAILQNARTYVSEESEWARRGRRIAAVREGRRMWDDIVGRWRDGELQMDEDLVCAMGRLLLLGRDRRDWDDVLSLVEQTMNIPRPVPRVLERDAKKEARMEAIEGAKRGLATGEKEESRIEAREEERFTAVKDEALEAGMELNEDEEGSDPHQEEEEEEEALSPEEETTEDADGKWYNERQFKPIAVNPKDPGKRRKIEVIGFASPGPNTLSLVLEACAAAHTLKVGTTYWELFTNGEGGLAIRPDLENYHVYLRMLRSSRSSGKVLELVRDQLIAKTGLTPAKKTFHIALSVCKRDSNNPHVFENADQLVELMHRTVPDQDIMSLVTYLDLAALVAGPSDRKNPSRTNPDPIIRALKRLESVFQNVKSMIYYGRSTDMKFPTELERSSVVLLARRMLGLYDRLIGDGLVRREMYGHYAGQKRSLSTFLTKVMHGDEMMRARKKEKSGKDERSTAAAAAAAARRIEDDDADWNSP